MSEYTIDYKKLPNVAPNYFLVVKDFSVEAIYEEGFKVNNLFTVNNVGIVTGKDELFIDTSAINLENKISTEFEFDENKIQSISYFPFDEKYIYYDTKKIERAREKIMLNYINKSNIGLILAKQCVSDWRYIFITNKISNFNLTASAGRFGAGSTFPLYLYPETTGQQNAFEQEVVRVPNLNMEIVNKMANNLGMYFASEKPDYNTQTEETNQLYPIDILDYIYAVLHSPSYREKYKEFLKIDFPRVPYPETLSKFETLTKLGSELRQIHLLESEVVEKFITQYPIDGDNVVVKPRFEKNNSPLTPLPKFETLAKVNEVGNVFINETQYFANVPEVAWNFYIGGYQPAQKWLKDRKDRELSYEDIRHYQKIIVALTETDRLMKEIDEIEI